MTLGAPGGSFVEHGAPAGEARALGFEAARIVGDSSTRRMKA